MCFNASVNSPLYCFLPSSHILQFLPFSGPLAAQHTPPT
jgi:hypothetical protein